MQVERLEDAAALRVGEIHRRLAIVGKNVEDDEGHRDSATAMEHPCRQAREARKTVLVEGDEFPVEHETGG